MLTMTYLFFIIETNNGSLFDIDAKSANECLLQNKSAELCKEKMQKTALY
jgi:hypothetical protein